MARLLDDLIATGRMLHPSWTTERDAARVRSYLPLICDAAKRATHVAVDNVTEYIFAQNPKETWYWRDFPQMTPPWPLAWIETRKPSRVVSEKHGVVSAAGPRQWAWFVSCVDFAPHFARMREMGREAFKRETAARMDDADWKRYAELYDVLGRLANCCVVDDVRVAFEACMAYWAFEKRRTSLDYDRTYSSVPRFLMDAVLFEQYDRETVYGPVMCMTFGLDDQGDCIDTPVMSSVGGADARVVRERLLSTGLDTTGMPDQAVMQAVFELLEGTMFPVCMAFSLLNCKNVHTEEDAPPEKVNRKRVQAGKEPLHTYKTLVVDALPGVSRKRAGDGQPVPSRLHIVRGKFRDYREGNGLFGKHHGRYWFPQHTRGDAARGTVTKGYEVEV